VAATEVEQTHALNPALEAVSAVSVSREATTPREAPAPRDAGAAGPGVGAVTGRSPALPAGGHRP